MGKLAETLKSMKTLYSLTLGTNECVNITDRGVLKLLKALESHKEIEHLCIGLEKCQITNKSVETLKDLISKLKCLQKLQLKFSGFKKISHEAFVQLGSAMIGIKSLNRIAMDHYPFSPTKSEPPIVIEECGTDGLWNFM